MTFLLDSFILKLKIGETKITRNNTETKIDVAPLIIDGRTLVPITFISEDFGTDATWNESSNSANILSGEMKLPDEEVLNINRTIDENYYEKVIKTRENFKLIKDMTYHRK